MIWKKFKCSDTNAWIKKGMLCNSKNEQNQTIVETWMELEDTMLCKVI